MKTRDEAMHIRPEGRIETVKKSRSQLRREDTQSNDRHRLSIPRPKPVIKVCLYCGAEYKNAALTERCPKCATPF